MQLFALAGSLVRQLAGDSSDEGKARIETLHESSRAEVRAMLETHRGVIKKLRDTLLTREELIGDEISDANLAAAAKPVKGVASA